MITKIPPIKIGRYFVYITYFLFRLVTLNTKYNYETDFDKRIVSRAIMISSFVGMTITLTGECG